MKNVNMGRGVHTTYIPPPSHITPLHLNTYYPSALTFLFTSHPSTHIPPHTSHPSTHTPPLTPLHRLTKQK